MRDFSWKYFTLTGDVESFMLYKEVNQYGTADEASALPLQHEEAAGMDVEE